MKDPKPIGELLRALMERYRLADPDTWSRLQSEWDTVAGQPWTERTVPLSLKGGELVVEAVTPAAVGMLRYGVTSLVEKLNAEYGEGVVTSVRVIPPTRR
ncbi:MAG: DUF721 domain-containing protein [Acidimicrobiia bacterium]